MKRYLWILMVALAMVALVGAACGGDDDDAASDDEPTSASESNDGGDDDSSDNGDDDGSGDDGDASGDDDGGSDDGDNGGDDDDGDSGDDDGGGVDDSDGGGDDGEAGLSAVMAAAQSLSFDNSFRVVFKMSGSGPSGADTFEGTFTIASEPPNNLVMMEGTFEEVPSMFSLISTDTVSYTCVQSEDASQCLEFPSQGGQAPFELPAILNAPELIGEITTADGVTVTSAGSDTIAGQSADCYNVVSPADGSAYVCISGDDGTLLLLDVDSNDGSQFLLEVTEFGSPSASDFEPPFPVISFGN